MEHTFTISIDGEPFSLTVHTLTADQVLGLAGLSATDHYLVLVHGKTQESFQGRGGALIHLHEGAKFVSVFTGPTTV